MKKFYTIISILFVGNLIAFAQPVLNQSDFIPNPTWTLNSYVSDEIPNLSAGASGPNVTWDYSGIVANQDETITSIVSLATTPNAADFPTANFVLKTTYPNIVADPYYTYIKASSTDLESLGSGDINTLDIDVNGSTLFTFPYTYETAYTDFFQYGNGDAGHTALRTYDGYGTFISPYGTINNVLRQKSVEINGNATNTDYLYFTANPFKLIAATSFYADGNSTYNDVIFYVDTNLSVKANHAINALTIYPNPTNSILNLDYSNALAVDKVRIIDITGKIVLQQDNGLKQINVEKLVAGLYIIEAFSGNDKIQKKFVKK